MTAAGPDDQLFAVSTTPTPPYNYSWFSVATTADLNAFYFYEVRSISCLYASLDARNGISPFAYAL